MAFDMQQWMVPQHVQSLPFALVEESLQEAFNNRKNYNEAKRCTNTNYIFIMKPSTTTTILSFLIFLNQS
jgi:hypothetical protein